jgi:uncharacterized membrane protein YhaH (DUF805 family)
MGGRQLLKNLAKSIEKKAQLLCALCLILPIILLVCAPLHEKICSWLTEDHPIRALSIVSLVLAIAWASHTLEMGLAGPSFWVGCMVLTVGTMLWMAGAEFLGYSLQERAKEFANIAIIMLIPVVLIFIRIHAKEGK